MGFSEQSIVNLIMRAKIVNQSSDFPVRRTVSYRHKKSTGTETLPKISIARVGRTNVTDGRQTADSERKRLLKTKVR